MPLAALAPVLAAAAGGTAAVVGSKIASNANRNASDIAAKSQSDASAAQTKSNEDTIAFTKQQAENDYRNQEITRKANYDQYAAGQNRLKFLDNEVGLPERQVPSYVPSQDPNFGGTPSAGQVLGSPSSGPTAAVDGSPASISAFFKSKGVSDQETPYWVSKWPELVARGKELGDPNYAMKRLSAADILGGGGPTAAQPTTAPASAPYSAASYLQQRTNPLPTALSY